MERAYRASTRLIGACTFVLGLAMIVVTLARGGGPLAVGRGRRRPVRACSARSASRPHAPARAVRLGSAASEPPARPRAQRRARLRERAAGAEARIARSLGALALFAIGLSAVGASIYFSLGVVAGNALGLTPLAFLFAGVFFVLTMMTYVEGGVLHPERGGASSLARYAFNELWSFIAGWAILLDYLIVIAIASFSISHYLAVVLGPARTSACATFVIAAVAIAVVAVAEHPRPAASTGCGWSWRLAAQPGRAASRSSRSALSLFWDPGAITDSIHLGTAPQWDDLIFATVVATVALTGIEAASGLRRRRAGGAGELRRLVMVGDRWSCWWSSSASRSWRVMAVPVSGGHDGARRRSTSRRRCSASSTSSIRTGSRTRSAAGRRIVASLALLQAANTSMLGLSRLSYSLATNRQIPAALGQLHRSTRRRTWRSSLAAVLAFALRAPARHRVPRGHLRVRRDAGVRARAHVGRSCCASASRRCRARSGCR